LDRLDVVLLTFVNRRLFWAPFSAVTSRSRPAGAGRSDWWGFWHVLKVRIVSDDELTGMQGFFSLVASFFLLRERYPPRLLELKTRRLRKETCSDGLRSKDHTDATPAQLLPRSTMKSVVMLVRCSIVGIVSLFLAIAYSYMYLHFTTFTDVFETTYGFNAGEAGLSYLGLGVGFLFGQYTFDMLVQWRSRRLSAMKQEMAPEDQLPPLVLSSLLIAAVCVVERVCSVIPKP
jgi:hypothetical protein